MFLLMETSNLVCRLKKRKRRPKRKRKRRVKQLLILHKKKRLKMQMLLLLLLRNLVLLFLPRRLLNLTLLLKSNPPFRGLIQVQLTRKPKKLKIKSPSYLQKKRKSLWMPSRPCLLILPFLMLNKLLTS